MIGVDKEDTTDYCTNENQLREYYCKESSTGIASDHYTCPEGCLGEEECFDSDKGPMLYEKGHTIDKQHDADYWDTCLDENTLREYFCGVKNYQYYSFECPNGCEDGALHADFPDPPRTFLGTALHRSLFNEP